MRICAISDTHGQHRKINVPKCDVFVFAGDMSFFDSSLKQYVDFNDWLGTLPCLYKIVVAGNHDEFFEKKPLQARSVMTNCIYLQDEEVVIDGVKFYGSPHSPVFYDWAFNLPRGKRLAEKWAMIPDDTDILITHTAPHQICDWAGGINVGCEELQKRVFEVKPKLHVFGHIHESRGKIEKHGFTTFFNVVANRTNYVYEIDFDGDSVEIIGAYKDE